MEVDKSSLGVRLYEPLFDATLALPTALMKYLLAVFTNIASEEQNQVNFQLILLRSGTFNCKILC